MNIRESTPPKTGVFALVIAATIAVMVALTLVAGLPPTENLGGFVVGVVVLLAITAALGTAGWYLLLKPLPDGVKVGTPVTIGATTRSVIVLLPSLSTFAMGIGAVWDEVWHARYGIPFGEDFFWRPHLLLYFSFLSMIVLGGWSWWTLMTRARGTLQQKFQANPLLGFSVFSGIFTLYAILADPVWHSFYGEDLSSWSVPHLLIILLILVMGSQAIAFYKKLMHQQAWQIGFRHFQWSNVLMMLLLCVAMLAFLMFFTVEWYLSINADPAAIAVASAGGDATAITAAAPESGRRVSLVCQVAAHPDWLFPTCLTFLAMLFGTMALHNTRQVGSATFVGLMTFGVRWALESVFDSTSGGTTPLYLIIPILLVLDGVYACSLRRTGKTPAIWLSGVVVAVTLTLLSAPLLSALFPFIPRGVGVLPWRFMGSLVAALGAIWLAQMISALIGEASSVSQAPVTAQTRRVTALVYGGFSAFLVFFILTATPPV